LIAQFRVSAALVLGTDVRFPEKNWPAGNRFFYWCCAACLRGAMRENIGSVGAMRERDRIDLGSTTERHLDFYFVIFWICSERPESARAQ
jgi:hypothetical protein